MDETMYTISFWRPGSDDYCPMVTIRHSMDYEDTATVCASLKARGYLVQVDKLTMVDTPELKETP